MDIKTHKVAELRTFTSQVEHRYQAHDGTKTSRPIVLKEQAIFRVDYDDLNILLSNEYYGENKTVFESHLECPNDTEYFFSNITKEPLLDYDQRSLKEDVERKCCEWYHMGVHIQNLVNKGKLPEGNYLISVSW